MLAAQQIIEAIKTRISGNTDAGTRVYADRLYPLTEELLPAWLVFPVEENLEPQSVHWPLLRQHRMSTVLQANAKAVSGYDAALSALRLQAVQALFDTSAHATLGISGVQMHERGWRTGAAERNDVQLAQGALHLEITFRTLADAPEAFA
jgi:hypothetical protein